MKENMNNGFINRNRIYRMNRNAAMNENAIINNDLFCLPEEMANASSVDIDIDRSVRPFAIGVYSELVGNEKHYFAYENDIHCESKWTSEFENFKHAVIFAREVYNYRVAERNIVYKYEEDTRVHRK